MKNTLPRASLISLLLLLAILLWALWALYQQKQTLKQQESLLAQQETQLQQSKQQWQQERLARLQALNQAQAYTAVLQVAAQSQATPAFLAPVYDSLLQLPENELVKTLRSNVSHFALQNDSLSENWQLAIAKKDIQILQASGLQSQCMGLPVEQVQHLTFNRQGDKLILAGYDHLLYVWDLEQKKITQTLVGHTAPVFKLQFSLDDRLLLSHAADHSLGVWFMQSNRPHLALGHPDWVYDAQFSPDSRYIVSAAADQQVRIWDADSGHLLHTLTGHQGPVYRVAFSSDGQQLLSIAEDGQVIRWQVKTGKQIQSYQNQAGAVLDAAFSPDDKQIASVALDGGLRIWAVDGRLLYTWRSPSDWLAKILWADNEHLLVSGNHASYWLRWSDSQNTLQLLATLAQNQGELQQAKLLRQPQQAYDVLFTLDIRGQLQRWQLFRDEQALWQEFLSAFHPSLH